MPEHHTVKIGGWTLDSKLNRIQRADEAVLLEPLAAQVLEYLAQNVNQVVSTDELIEQIWQRRLIGDDFADFATINSIYGDAMGDHRPARSTVQAAALPMGAKIEIDMVARQPAP